MDNSNLIQNAPNASLNNMTYTPIFGNMNFMIQPSQSGEVSDTYAIVPTPPSLESLVYLQQMNAQVSPTNIVSGQNTGEQNIQGAYTVKDTLNNTRVSIGFQQTDTGSY